MTTMRSTIPDFQLANPLYIGAVVTFFTVDGSGNETATLATLYGVPTGTQTLPNPQILDSEGKFSAPVYIQTPVIAEVTSSNVPSHKTGIIAVRGTWRGDWVTDFVYYSTDQVQDPVSGNVYIATNDYTSGASLAADISAGNLILGIDRTAIASGGVLFAIRNLSDVANEAAALSNLGGAPLNSPVLTGAPEAPTASPGADNTQIATTAYTDAAVAAGKVSPALTGNPTTTTQTFGDNSNKIASDAFVQAAVAAAKYAPGVVHMRYLTGAWIVLKPDGTVLATPGTTTSGLQEAINYAQTNGYGLDVAGPAMTTLGANVATIECTTAITINPTQYWNLRISGVIIDFPSSASVSGAACITIGTLAFCTIDFDCTIQCGATCSHIVQIIHNGVSAPSSNPYVEDNEIHIRSIIAYGNAQTSCLNISGVTYSVNNNLIRVGAILSGGFATFGLLVVNPVGATSGVVQNIVEIGLIVGSLQTEAQIGTSSFTDPLAANIWKFGGLTPGQAGMTSALSAWSFDDTFYIGSISINAGTCTNGIFLGSSSKNIFLVAGQCDIATPPVTDNGTNNTYFVGGAADGKYHVKLGVPTASTGLASGELYANSGVLTRA